MKVYHPRGLVEVIGLTFFLVFLYLVSHGHAQRIESSLGHAGDAKPVAMTGTELHFYQMEPTCEGKMATYLVVPGKLYTTEMHKVWVCGYRR